MDILAQVAHGFVVAAQPANLWFLFIGALLGTVFGMMPGIGASTTIALLLPVTFGMDALPALIMLSGIYYGAMFGGAGSAILLNTPGTASTAMTTMDGYPMARNGRGGAALAIAAIASFCAGTIGVIALSALAIPLSIFALRFGPAEYFMLMLFALTAVAGFTGRSVFKGLLSATFGLMIATVGVDMQTMTFRYTLGVPEFQNGISFLVVIVGLFAIAEVLRNVELWFQGAATAVRIKGRLWFTADEWRQARGAIGRGSVIGFLIGVLPGTGGTIATVLAYDCERKVSRQPERFGHGAVAGLAAPEAANNAATAGSLVPLLTLGVPGSGTAAILLAAHIMYGIQPGPLLFQHQPELVWGLINSMYLGNIMLLILNLPLIGLFVRILYIPPGILMGLILVIATVGTYSLNNSVVDLYLLLGFGVLGYLFRKTGVPIPPLILGLVLGAGMEQNLRQAMIISDGDPSYLVASPIAATLAVLALLVIGSSIVTPVLKARRRASGIPDAVGNGSP